MDDELRMGELHCAEHLKKEYRPFADRQPGLVAVAGQRYAFNIFHGEVGLARGTHASVV